MDAGVAGGAGVVRDEGIGGDACFGDGWGRGLPDRDMAGGIRGHL